MKSNQFLTAKLEWPTQPAGDVNADAGAKAIYMQLYPGREVIQINIDPIAAGGGGIHCTTQQEVI